MDILTSHYIYLASLPHGTKESSNRSSIANSTVWNCANNYSRYDLSQPPSSRYIPGNVHTGCCTTKSASVLLTMTLWRNKDWRKFPFAGTHMVLVYILFWCILIRTQYAHYSPGCSREGSSAAAPSAAQRVRAGHPPNHRGVRRKPNQTKRDRERAFGDAVL